MTSMVDDIKNDLENTLLCMKFELRKHLRRKRLLIGVTLAILLPLIFYALPPLLDIDYSDSAIAFANTNLGFINLLIVISGAIFAGDAISGEFENKTGLLLFPTPQRRTSIFVGKYLAALIAIFAVVSIYYLITILEIIDIYGASEISQEMIKSYLLALLYSSSVISVIYFFSCFFKLTITSSIFGFFFLMMILPIISMVLIVSDIEPWFIVTYPAELVTSVLGLSSELHGPGGGGNTPSFEADFYEGIMVMVGYTVILFIVTMFMANRKRIE